MYDILCVFGRGIEKVGGTWQPTREIEQLSEKNGHPGVRAKDIGMNDDNERVVVAGAELNARAAAFFYSHQVDENNPPQIVVFAAGRPAYIADDPDPDLTEGSVLKKKFLEELEGVNCFILPNHRHETFAEGSDGKRLKVEPAVEIVIQGSNRNTRDDLLQTLHLAKERGLRGIAIISVLVHIARCQEFFKKAVEVEPEFKNYGVHFFPSEMLLMQASPEEYAWLPEFLISKAYCRTAARERKGIEDLCAGRYDFGTQGYSFAPTKT